MKPFWHYNGQKGFHNKYSFQDVREADYFGIVSGKKEDKFAKTGLTPVKSDNIKNGNIYNILRLILRRNT